MLMAAGGRTNSWVRGEEGGGGNCHRRRRRLEKPDTTLSDSVRQRASQANMHIKICFSTIGFFVTSLCSKKNPTLSVTCRY